MSEWTPVGYIRSRPEDCEYGDALAGVEWENRMKAMEFTAGFFVHVLYEPYIEEDPDLATNPYRHLNFLYRPFIVEGEKRWVYQRVSDEELEEISKTVFVDFGIPLESFPLNPQETTDDSTKS